MCERIRSRTTNSISERRALLSSPEPSVPNKKKSNHTRSEFSLMAAEISKQITNTAAKLEKLTKCKRTCLSLRPYLHDLIFIVAKRKTLFDDKPIEISVNMMIIL